ncbi:MAG: TIGR03756 family integrating conjugative element protein [Acidiferrobacterales bacterium]|nr:TIGR03756 family integrating conjugative element protein [Acidiferrobacterales bacterium]
MERLQKPVAVWLLSALFALSASSQSSAEPITTAEIISRSMSLDCLDWKISGICIWLQCSIFGCFVVTTPRISHRLPDLVVTSYPQSAKTPWVEKRPILQSIRNQSNSLLSGGSMAGVGNELMQQESLQYSEVDVIGNPASNSMEFGRFLCQSAAKPHFPYFISLIDHKAWRSGLPDGERREAKTPGEREIGDWPHHTWGSVFPRSGFVFQAHPGKAAAVNCQRAVDILLGDISGHVVNKFSQRPFNVVQRGDSKATNEDDCSRSGGSWSDRESSCLSQSWYQWLPKSDEKTDKWQMILPLENKSCLTFGKSPIWPYKAQAGDGEYIWNYWAKYKCCVKAGGILLTHFDF